MGNELRTIEITYKMSRHHSPRDLTDNARAAELNARIREVVVSPRYDSLSVSTNGLTLEFDDEQRFVTIIRNLLGQAKVKAQGEYVPLTETLFDEQLDEITLAAWDAAQRWRQG